MYKAMHQSIRSSEKLAELSDFAFRVWEMGVVASDMVGRISATPRKFHAEAMPLMAFDEAKTRAAFNEIEALKLVHRYTVDGKPFFVFHDHDEHNKAAKNLRNVKSAAPPPPPSLCYCVTYTKEEEDQTTVATVDGTVVATTVVPVHVPVPSSVPVSDQVLAERGEFEGERTRPVIRHLYQKAKEAKVAGRKETLISYLESWVARADAQRVEQYLMDPWSRGKTILEIQDHFWPKNGKSNGVGSIEEIMNDWVEKQK